jgi:hypothetical protein
MPQTHARARPLRHMPNSRRPTFKSSDYLQIDLSDSHHAAQQRCRRDQREGAGEHEDHGRTSTSERLSCPSPVLLRTASDRTKRLSIDSASPGKERKTSLLRGHPRASFPSVSSASSAATSPPEEQVTYYRGRPPPHSASVNAESRALMVESERLYVARASRCASPRASASPSSMERAHDV